MSMKFYYEMLSNIRKKNYISVNDITKALNICRATYWKWEKGITIPKPKQIRKLADFFQVSVSEISDLVALTDNNLKKSTDLSENIGSWLSFFDTSENRSFKKTVTDTLTTAINLSNKLNEAGVIIKALTTGIDSLFYIKNTELVYMTANDAFLENLGYDKSYVVFNKKDVDFFPKKEAEENGLKDEKVILSKEKSIEEGFIPGSRKKKWGIISRVPVFDLNNNVVGLITNIVDITNRRKTEHANNLLKHSINNIDDIAVIIYNVTDSEIVYANPYSAGITGYSMDELFNKKKDLVLNIFYSEEEKKKALEYRKKGVWPKDREIQFKCKDGKLKWAKVYSSRTHDFMDNEYMIAVTSDITDKKELRLIDSFKAAKTLKENNVSIDIISKSTGLPEDIITEI